MVTGDGYVLLLERIPRYKSPLDVKDFLTLSSIELSFQLNGAFCRDFVPYDFLLVVLHTMSIISKNLLCLLRGIV